MALVLHGGLPLGLLAAVLAAKIVASALSIGAGFRGGLFSTSLFLGAVTGALAGRAGVGFGFLTPGDVAMMSLVGMASFGAAVVGAPMTMALLAVEVTGDFSVVGPVLLGFSQPSSPSARCSDIRLPYGVFICVARPSSAAKISDGFDK